MFRRINLIALSLLMLGGVTAMAQESKLKDMPPIMHKLLMRGHRFEVMPVMGITLNDKYTRSLMMQVRGAYFLNDWLGVGLEITYGAPLKTALTKDIESELTKANHTTFSMSRSFINLIALPYASFTPFAGKFVVFDRHLGYADLHFDIGAGMAYVGSYAGTVGSIGSKATWTAMFGVGMRYFPIKALSIVVSFRDYLVPRTLAIAANGNSSQELTQNLAILLGVGFYFPRVPKRTE